jgi:hypothetical protein
MEQSNQCRTLVSSCNPLRKRGVLASGEFERTPCEPHFFGGRRTMTASTLSWLKDLSSFFDLRSAVASTSFFSFSDQLLKFWSHYSTAAGCSRECPERLLRFKSAPTFHSTRAFPLRRIFVCRRQRRCAKIREASLVILTATSFAMIDAVS